VMSTFVGSVAAGLSIRISHSDVNNAIRTASPEAT
jgi:hypothetical protein